MPLSTKNPGKKSERDRYLELIQQFPLRRLRSDEELSAAIGVIDSLIARGVLESGEQDYLDVLTDMVEKYETDEKIVPRVSEAGVLRQLIEARGLTQAKLSADVGIGMSTISEVLHGKRRLTRDQVALVSKYFGVPQAVFQL